MYSIVSILAAGSVLLIGPASFADNIWVVKLFLSTS